MSLTYMSPSLLLCTLKKPVDLEAKILKVRDDKVFSESVSQQHDVVPNTPVEKMWRVNNFLVKKHFSTWLPFSDSQFIGNKVELSFSF